MSRPYRETTTGSNRLRRFDSQTRNEELVWHRDAKHRYVKVVESNGWSLQFENHLPTRLIEGLSYFVEADEWHRLVKGRGDLVVEISEF